MDLEPGGPAVLVSQLCCLPRTAAGFLLVLDFQIPAVQAPLQTKTKQSAEVFQPSHLPRPDESRQKRSAPSPGPRVRGPWLRAPRVQDRRPGPRTDAHGKACCLTAPSQAAGLIGDATPLTTILQTWELGDGMAHHWDPDRQDGMAPGDGTWLWTGSVWLCLLHRLLALTFLRCGD